MSYTIDLLPSQSETHATGAVTVDLVTNAGGTITLTTQGSGPPGAQGPPGTPGIDPAVLTAHSMVKADAAAGVPVALAIPVSTLVGRAAAGLIAALTPAQVKTLLAIVAGDVAGLGTLATKNVVDVTTDVTPMPIPVANGGTGATTAAAARGNLGTMGKYNATIGDGTSTSFTLNHGLNRTAVGVELYDVPTGETVEARVTRLSSTQIRIDAAPAPTAASIGVIVWA